MPGLPALAKNLPPAAPCGTCTADCLEACFNDAIVAAAAGGVDILEDNCAGCGACAPACEFGLIRMQDGIARIVVPQPRLAPLPAQNPILE